MRRAIVVSILATLGLTGCATLNGSVPFKYVPTLASGEPIPQRIGMEKLTDTRPADDKSATSDLPDVDEKVTSKLLEDFRASQLFERIDFPARAGDDGLLMQGQITRFYWKYTTSPVIWIPVVQFAMYFGAPVAFMEGTAALSVQIVERKTGRVIGKYEKSSTREASSSLYNAKAGEFGAELADAFRDVVKQLKDAIGADARAGKFGLPAAMR